ncbi:MAG: hypothetical protein QXG39_02670 [Candidatus Aenigmatarchaeota archaeon]
MVNYPFDIHEKFPGMGFNVQPFNCDTLIDIDSPIGKGSAVYLSLIFQLPKWGFERVKIDEFVVVTPVFQQYYQLTIRQKEEFENMIKAGLVSIATALSDLELLKHDLRKYKEFMDYYKKIEVGKKTKNEKLRLEGEQSLKAIFIDQVDAHTDLPNQPIALRSIAARWPTIISDFMKLKDEDTNPEKIAKDYKVSEAEAVVLATKNKLYLEWRDELFKKAVEERFKSLVAMVEARKKSFEEYKNMLRPTLRRYKSIVDGLSNPSLAKELDRFAFWRPSSQGMSIDKATIWAWKPFVAEEKYKSVRETLDEIPAEMAGFTREEVEVLEKEGKLKGGMVKALPVEPSVDMLVRKWVKDIEEEYKVKITCVDIFNARERLVKNFEDSVRGTTSYEAWVFSPYFIFLEIPVYRVVIHLPDGTEIEDLSFERIKAYCSTQNVMIARLIELEAREKQLDDYLKQMLGEAGVSASGEVVDIDKIAEEYLIKLEEKKEEKKVEEKVNLSEPIEKILNFFGIKFRFFKAQVPYRYPYEFAFKDRITKYYLRQAAIEFSRVVSFIKSAYGAP